ncbi:DeoR/GlpR family transcriptional regulator of sugar metabolism [Aequitasia blattaphilus]|uniref:DeoR/GlpR family DNA-binding transcription regulator n=1 Tax=Aequitasia blattaphilus TaxID=2949332 RepID=A0ABT1E8P1_9FIRM|nr:DeoR/GlpR family DNA-binding transcription regulator [Aequitasia blattaphilus]MCP1102199.1 DeoR/GlpR family DNA-binding transcription regulator [Aequitasia blattaphilus]MCR8614839.1 DeoR/GlpR family DNA-binding transcription regulator [Aequitasia blattaphilus]
MLAIERRKEILEKLQSQKRVVVSELSQIYDVSEETIRRDLEKLEKDGYATKSYGGAVFNEHANLDLPLNIRKNRNVIEKQLIAKEVCQLIQDGDTVMLDASSTALYVAKALKEKSNLTIITNSIEIIIELLDKKDWSVLSTGGLSKEGTYALVGPQTDKMLQSYHVDIAVISCKGIDMKAGVTDTDELHSNNKRTMLNSAKKKVLAIDGTKFDQIGFTTIGELSDIEYVVTDKQPEERWKSFFEAEGILCMYP